MSTRFLLKNVRSERECGSGIVRVRLRAFLAALALFLIALGTAHAQTVKITLDGPWTDDAYLEQGDPFKSRGEDNDLRFGLDNSKLYRTLMRFDVQAAIPSVNYVASVRLVLPIESNDLDEGDMALYAYALTERWREGTENDGVDVSWVHRQDGIAWAWPGGTYDPARYSRATADPDVDSVVIDITDHVLAWAADSTQNHGLVFGDSIGFSNPAYTGDKQLFKVKSTEENNLSKRGYLLVTYVPWTPVGPAPVSSAIAEIAPPTMLPGSTDTLTLYLDLDFSFGDEGVGLVHIGMPPGFVFGEITRFLKNGSPYGSYDENASPDTLTVDFWSEQNTDATYEISISVEAPAVSDTVTFAPRLENENNSQGWSFATAGNANGNPGDWDLLELHVKPPPLDPLAKAIGEMSPDSVGTGGLDTLSLWLDLAFDPGDEGIRIIECPMPANFSFTGLVGVYFNGFAFNQFNDQSANDTLRIDLWSELENDASLEIRFAVNTPASGTRVIFEPLLKNVEDSGGQAIPVAGNANGIAKDWDLLQVDVAGGGTSIASSFDGEIQPVSVFVSLLDTMTLFVDLKFNGASAGLDFVRAEMPPGFGMIGITGVRRWNAPYMNYTDLSDSSSLLMSVESSNTSNGVIEISFAVQTPDTAAIGAYFLTRIGNKSTKLWQAVPEGNANGINGDWDLLRTDVSTVYGAFTDLFLTPADTQITAGSAVTIMATVADVDSNLFTPHPDSISWSEPRGLGSVNNLGTFTTTTAGTTYVRASYASVMDSARVIVVGGALDHIVTTPAIDTVSADSTRQYYAAGFDLYNNPVAIAPIWNVIAGIGSVSGTGFFTPSKIGTGTVRGHVGPIRGNASVTVVPGGAKTVVIAPGSLTAFPGDTVTYTATAFDTLGTPLAASTGAWSTLNGFGASLGGGSILAVSPGLEQVVFEMNARRDTASLTIFTVVLDSIRIAPASASITADSSLTFTATGYYSDASNSPIIPTWSVLGGVGSVNTGGLFTPSAIGMGYVLAVSGSFRDSSAIVVTSGALDSIAIVPDSQSVVPGDMVSFTYNAYDRLGTPIATSSPTWSALDGNALSLGSGAFRGLFTGSERVVCTIGVVSDTATLGVLPARLDGITISPAAASLTADSSLTFAATGHYSDGSSAPVVAAWIVTGSLGTIDGAGWFDAVKKGTGSVIAAVGAVRDTVSVTVTAGRVATVKLSPAFQSASEGDTVSVTARGYDGDGNEIIPFAGGSWSSSPGYSISLGGGLFVCDTIGVDTIAAFFSGIGDSATLQITGALLDSITIAPVTAVTTTDSMIVFIATGHYDDATTAPVTPTWTLTGGIGTILIDGTFDPTTPGAGLVIATKGVHRDTADVTVSIGAVWAVTIVPAIDTIAVGDSIAFTATAMDADSNVFVPPFAWSEPTALGTVDGTGLFVSAALGRAEILVGAAGIIDTAGITITPGPLATLTIAPAPDTLSSDTTLAFSVSGFDAYGFPVPVNPFWSVIGSIGSINGSGSFTGDNAGYGAVVAREGSIADTVWFEVIAGRPQTVSVLPDSAATTAGDTISFVAVVRDGQGNVVDTTVVWSDGGFGTVDADGDFTGTAAGTGGVTAALGTILDDAVVVVTAGTPVTFAIAPHDTTVTADDTVPFALTGADVFGNPVALSGAAWNGGASIGAIDIVSGLFDATTAGTGTVNATSNDTTISSGPITVVPGRVASVEVLPSSMLVPVGADSAFVVKLRDADGNITSGPAIWSTIGIIGTVDAAGLFSADSAGNCHVIATAGAFADTSAVTVFDDAGLRITAVLESRISVIQGEEGVLVRLAITNESGSAIENLDANLDFTIGGADVSTQYTALELASKSHTIANGESDTLTFTVTVLGTATTDEIVTIDASASGVLQVSGFPSADLAADATGEWIVLPGLLLDDVARSFYPGKMRPGQSAAFVILLRNEGAEDLLLRTGTRLVIDNGATTMEASLLEAVSLPAGGSGSTARFAIGTIPLNWGPGSYALTFIVDGENAVGIPLATTYTAKKNALLIAPPYVHVTARGVEGEIHPPGTAGVVLAHLELVNLYETDRTLSSMRARNATDGTGAQQDRDGVLTAVRVVHDRNRDGLVDEADTTLGTGVFADGYLTFDDLGFTLAPEDTLSLLTTADVSLLEAPDGTHIDVSFTGDTLSFDCGAGTVVYGADSLFSPGDHFIDGMVAAQIAISAPFSPNISAGATDSLALVLDVPSNGYEPDTIRSLAIRNFGTAEFGLDIAAVHIWTDGGNGVFDRGSGDDTRLGEAAWIGEGYWSLSERVLVPHGGVRMYATVDITEFARESQTIRLGVPVDGADMTSRNDGPIDVEARLFTGRTIGSANRILFSQTNEAGERAVPPGFEAQLLRFTLSNLYSDTVSVRSISILDDSNTNPDSAFSKVTLYREDVTGGRIGITETVISGGTGMLSGFQISIPPGELCSLAVEGTVAKRCVSDGDELSLRIESAGSLKTGLSRFVAGIFPATTTDPLIVNGFSTLQMRADTLGDGPIAPGGAEQLLLHAWIPSNGCDGDRFRAIEVLNAGTAVNTAFSSLRMEAGGANVGALVWDGLTWVRDGFDVEVPAGGLAIELYGSVAFGSPEGSTIRLRIPIDGIDMESGNDGPVDDAFDAPDRFTITDAPLFTRFAAPPTRVSAGQSFDVTLSAINISPDVNDTLWSVVPDAFSIAGPATVTAPFGSAIAVLAPGDTVSFTWTVRAESAGSVNFSGNATAIGPEGLERSLTSTTPPVTVQNPASGVIVSVVSAIPSSITRGSRDLRAFVLDCSHQNDPGTGHSNIDLCNLTFHVTNEDGVKIDPQVVLDRAVVQKTGVMIGESGASKNTDSTVTVTFTEPVRIVPGGGTSLVLLFDLADSSSIARFRIAFDEAGTLNARDANSANPVSTSGNIPYLSEVVGLFNTPSGLSVAIANLLPGAVNRGSEDVKIGELTLSSSGIPEETASILADNLCLVVTDTTFPYATLSVWAGDVRHFAGSGWSTQGDTLYLPLIPALGIPANNPIRMTLRGHVGSNAPLGASQIDSAFVLIRSAVSDSLAVTVAEHEAFATTITERITEVAGRAQNRVPIDPVFQGSRAVPLLDVVFEPTSKDNGASALLRAIMITVSDTNAAAVPISDLAELVILSTNGKRVGAASAAGLSGNALRIPLDEPMQIRPGMTRSLALLLDIKANAPRDDYRFSVPVTGIELEDENAGTPVSFVTTVDTLQTSVLAVREVTSRVDLYFDTSLPATSIGAGAVENGAVLRILASSKKGDATLHLSTFAIALEDESGNTIVPADLITSAVAHTSTGSEVEMTLAGDRLVATFADGGEAITPGDTLAVSVDWTVADNPNVASYRVRIIEDAVALAENVALIARAFDDPGENPSGLTYFVDKQFETSLRNYPNPFAVKDGTTIAFYCSGAGRVSVNIFTGLGVPVTSITRTIDGPGLMEIFWQGRNGDQKNVISGVYLASIVVAYNDGKRDHAIHKIAVLN